MLIDPQHLDIHIRNRQRTDKHSPSDTTDHLHGRISTKRLIHNHEHPRGTHKTQRQHRIPIHAVEQQRLVPDDRHELEAHQKGSGQDGPQVHDDADAVSVATFPAVEVAFAWCSSFGWVLRVAEDAVDVEVHEAGEREAHEGANGDEEEEEVVPVGEVEGVIYLAEEFDEAI